MKVSLVPSPQGSLKEKVANRGGGPTFLMVMGSLPHVLDMSIGLCLKTVTVVAFITSDGSLIQQKALNLIELSVVSTHCHSFPS